MVNIRGFGFRLHPKAAFVKLTWYGLFFLILSLISVIFLISSSPTVNYPYNMYKGFPLTLYDNPYNINKTECRGYKVVVVVHSAVTNFNKRDVIRKTWGNKALLRRYRMKLVFFLGMPFNKDLQVLIDGESVENNDIVQGNFLDSYTNITHKAVLWLRWISEKCPDADTVLKLDDDVFVNVFSFHHYLPLFETTNKHERRIWCEVLPVGKQRITRNAGKWRVAEHELTGLTHYPLTLCRGYFVVITMESVRAMYEAAKDTPFFWIDDFYVFGTLANKTGSHFSSMKQYLADERNAVDCFTSANTLCQLLGVLLDSNSAMENFWKYTIQQQNSLSR